jgi:hypothetical protein
VVLVLAAATACAEDTRYRELEAQAVATEEWSREVHAYVSGQQGQLELAAYALTETCELAGVSLAECPVVVADARPLSEPPSLSLYGSVGDRALAIEAWAEAFGVWSAELNDYVADLERRTDEYVLGLRYLCETAGGSERECRTPVPGPGAPALRTLVFPPP